MTLGQELSKELSQLADLFELEGEKNKWQLAAYRQAARTVEVMPDQTLRSINEVKVAGIGHSLTKIIDEYVRSRKIRVLEALRGKFPDVSDLTRVSGIGVKTAAKLHAKWGITTIVDLKKLLDAGEIQNERWRAGIEFAERRGRPHENRLERDLVEICTGFILDRVKAVPGIADAVFAGSIRRKMPTVKDADLLAKLAPDAGPETVGKAIEVFLGCGDQPIGGGSKAASMLMLRPGFSIRVDLLCVETRCWGAALNHFTGPKDHNIELRTLAKSRGILVSEDGITRVSDGAWLGGEKETDLYEVLGIPYVEPEKRT